jgi:hypothetical protein
MDRAPSAGRPAPLDDGSVRHAAPAVYERLLNEDRGWALSEGSRHFEGKGAVQETLRKIAARLDELGVPYAIAEDMALFTHGFRRFTEDVDILVTPEGLKSAHVQLEGRGYLPPFAGSKQLRDTEHGVRIEFLVTGQYPGDGKPKPVAFPDPAAVAVEFEGINSESAVPWREGEAPAEPRSRRSASRSEPRPPRMPKAERSIRRS